MSDFSTNIDRDASLMDDYVDREEFYRKIEELYKRKRENTFLLTRKKYEHIIEQVKAAKTKASKTPKDYRRIKRFAVVKTPSGELLYTVAKQGQKEPQLFVPVEEIFDIIREYHLKLKHGGRSRMMVALKPKYKNITAESVLVYLNLCKCSTNKGVKRRAKMLSTTTEVSVCSTKSDADSVEELNDIDPFESKLDELMESENENTPTTTKSYPELYSRGQVDILDVMNTQNEEFKYMMVYRNFVTRFTHLKALKEISMEEIGNALLDIFLVFGAPNILQSKNGMSITKSICRRISTLFPDIKVLAAEVNSCSDFKGKSNDDILLKLSSWYESNKTSKWQYGLKYVQYSLNTTFNNVICMTPNEFVFGTNPRKGIASCLSNDEYEDIDTENDLKTILEDRVSIGTRLSKCFKLQESLIRPSNFIKEETDPIDQDDIDELE